MDTFGDLSPLLDILGSLQAFGDDNEKDKEKNLYSNLVSSYKINLASNDNLKWYQRFKEKFNRKDESKPTYSKALNTAKTISKSTGDHSLKIQEVLEDCLKILTWFDWEFLGAYHLISHVLFNEGFLEAALDVCELGLGIEEGECDEMLLELKGDILHEIDSEAPLLNEDDSDLSVVLKGVLSSIFNRHDKGSKGVLSFQDFQNYFSISNPGESLTRETFHLICKTFKSESGSSLSFSAFLFFYHRQSLLHPSETRHDLQLHGYDPKTLLKIAFAAAA